MIKIKRVDCPQSLHKPESEFCKSDYKKQDVKDALLVMQKRKCCYCEKSLDDLGPVEKDVDHYIPQMFFKGCGDDVRWHLANDWMNLLYACRSCNSRKTSRHPINQTTGLYEIINPSDEDTDPEEHIDFIIEPFYVSYKERNASSEGRATVDNLKFKTRTDLYAGLRKRKAVIENTFRELIEAKIAHNDAEIESKKRELRVMMSAHQPFAAFSRRLIEKILKELNEDQLPKLKDQQGNSLDRIEDIEILKGYEIMT